MFNVIIKRYTVHIAVCKSLAALHNLQTHIYTFQIYRLDISKGLIGLCFNVINTDSPGFVKAAGGFILSPH